ncbi:MAG: acetate/propionate family kinase [Gemmatimonadota bacterium]|nr:acetate/propionate family kinase [Gemmatimonadota bacterium]
MNILALNAGSSSVKASLFQLEHAGSSGDLPRGLMWEAETGIEQESLQILLAPLWSGAGAILPDRNAIHAIVHRVVHGGATLVDSVRVTDDVVTQIKKAAEHAAWHNESALELIKEARELFGDAIPQVAVFDTAFHKTLPPVAYTYAGPYEWIGQGIRKFGFHGISHQYASARGKRLLTQATANFRLVSCHLGSGCSLAAVRNGASVDTTMGFTPLDGLPMATRSGAVDPGILIHLLRHGGHTAGSLDHMLNYESGLAGLSGTNGDMREVLKAADAKVERGVLALDVFIQHVRQGIAAMAVSMGGIDALVFTGGMGEQSPRVRDLICDGLTFLRVSLDSARNEAVGANDVEISSQRSAVRVLVVHAEENWVMAQECARVVATAV